MGEPLYLTLKPLGQSPLRFVMSMEEFTDGYTNDIADAGSQYRATPAYIQWKGGKFDDLTIELKLAVLRDGMITTPDELVTWVTKLVNLAIRMKGEKVPREVILGLGTWWKRRCVVTAVKPKYMAPWNLPDGKPMRCEVSVSLKPSVGAAYRGEDSSEEVTEIASPIELDSLV